MHNIALQLAIPHFAPWTNKQHGGRLSVGVRFRAKTPDPLRIKAILNSRPIRIADRLQLISNIPVVAPCAVLREAAELVISCPNSLRPRRPKMQVTTHSLGASGRIGLPPIRARAWRCARMGKTGGMGAGRAQGRAESWQLSIQQFSGRAEVLVIIERNMFFGRGT